MSLLSELTIIVPSYNRQVYLLRLLNYWLGGGVRIIACDGTKHPISDTQLANLESNIVYVHSPIKACDIIFLLEKSELKAQGIFDELTHANEGFRAIAATH